jgi:hypothetical protein
LTVTCLQHVLTAPVEQVESVRVGLGAGERGGGVARGEVAAGRHSQRDPVNAFGERDAVLAESGSESTPDRDLVRQRAAVPVGHQLVAERADHRDAPHLGLVEGEHLALVLEQHDGALRRFAGQRLVGGGVDGARTDPGVRVGLGRVELAQPHPYGECPAHRPVDVGLGEQPPLVRFGDAFDGDV